MEDTTCRRRRGVGALLHQDERARKPVLGIAVKCQWIISVDFDNANIIQRQRWRIRLGLVE